MFIWTAIDVESQLPNYREAIRRIGNEIACKDPVTLLLPLHISLKISAEVPNEIVPELRRDLTNLLAKTEKFEIDVATMEQMGQIVWLKMKENEHLSALHQAVCDLFQNQYSIPLHDYDYDFLFHTTLFFEDDVNTAKAEFERIKEIPFPAKLEAKSFVIGSSPEGKNGTYRVDSEIHL